jgi:AcrR family transcriptional regulator
MVAPTSAVERHERRPRADAVRNRARIVDAARAVFTERGADASLEEIARVAGVGIGTLYRHFPTRSDLVVAVFHDRVDQLEALASDLLEADDPGAALAVWLHAQLDNAAICQRLAAEAMLAMLDAPDGEQSPCETMRRSATSLLVRAQAAGVVRPGVDVDDLVRMVQAIVLVAEQSPDPDTAERLFAMMLDGVRTA